MPIIQDHLLVFKLLLFTYKIVFFFNKKKRHRPLSSVRNPSLRFFYVFILYFEDWKWVLLMFEKTITPMGQAGANFVVESTTFFTKKKRLLPIWRFLFLFYLVLRNCVIHQKMCLCFNIIWGCKNLCFS